MTTSLPVTARARTVLRLDAAFESVLAVGCLIFILRSPTTGAWTLPAWLGRPLLALLVVMLAVAAGVLQWLSSRADTNAIRAVAMANAATALVLFSWVCLSSELGLWPRLVLVVAAIVLLALGATQLRLARRG